MIIIILKILMIFIDILLIGGAIILDNSGEDFFGNETFVLFCIGLVLLTFYIFIVH